MEILQENAGLLSNYEVLALATAEAERLKAKGDETKVPGAPQNVMTCLYQVRTFLADTECAVQSDDVIRDFLKRLLPYNLTKAEKLMLLNNRPVAESVLVTMLEECEERFSEDQRGEMLDITSSLPEPPEVAGEEGGTTEYDGEQVADDGNADEQWEDGENDAEYDEETATDNLVNEKDAVNSEGEGDD